MTGRDVSLTRRGLLQGLVQGLAGAGLGLVAPSPGDAQGVVARPRTALTLRATAGSISLRGGAETALWRLARAPEESELRFARGDDLAVSFENNLPAPAVLNWRGLDGVAGAEPLAARRAMAAGGRDEFVLPLRQAGTLLADLRLLGDAQLRPSPLRALVVQESEPVAVDLDRVVLIEDWRLDGNGDALAPGTAPGTATPLYTVNGLSAIELTAAPQSRLRLRFINGCQRAVIAIRIEDHEVRVMALDGQPAEPFLARNGQIVLAPGTRIDVFVDAIRPPGSSSAILLHDGKEPRPIGQLKVSTAPAIRAAALGIPPPLPGNGLPAQLDLKSALRVDLALGLPDWSKPAEWSTTAAPAFAVKRNRVVVLALTNRAATPCVFHLHGHHFRLLDRLDDGWKPFWLDTLLLDAGQTQRIAFAAEFFGVWLMEAVTTDWMALRRIRGFVVE